MLRGVSILSKVALATAIGGAVPLFSGATEELAPSIFQLQSISEPVVFDKAYGLPITEIPKVPERLMAVLTQPEPSITSKESLPELPPATAPTVCPFNVRAIIGATDGGKPFTVLEYKGESSVHRVGDTIRAGTHSYRLSKVRHNHLILRHRSGDISHGGQRRLRCSLQ